MGMNSDERILDVIVEWLNSCLFGGPFGDSTAEHLLDTLHDAGLKIVPDENKTVPHYDEDRDIETLAERP